MSRYSQTIAALEARGIMPQGMPSLEPTKRALMRLGLSFHPERVLVVAGTNGKGSTCATLEALLQSAGCHVGLYTSPHLVDTTERIRLCGQDVDCEEFCAAHDVIAQTCDGITLSHFEMLTLMAFWIFTRPQHKLDWLIFEVGLGGLWDATNAIPHEVCIITRLGFDHENLLGPDLADIARNKFGIVTEGALVVHTGFEVPEVVTLAQEVARTTQSRWVAVQSENFTYEVTENKNPKTKRQELSPKSLHVDPTFVLLTPWGSAPLTLPGPRAVENTALALTVFQELDYDPKAHLSALSHVHWPGRMQKIHWPLHPHKRLYLSGDHNPQGIASLLDLLPHYPRRHLHILVGIGVEKDCNGVLDPLFQLPYTSVYLTETPYRGRSLQDYGPWLERAAGAWTDVFTALDTILKQAHPKDLILVTGSLYLVGKILEFISKPQNELR